MFGLFCLINFITIIMLIWLKSDAIIEWSGVIGLSKLLKKDEFFDERLKEAICGRSLSYPEFLKQKYNYNFITKMLSCPLCLSVWLSSIVCLITSIVLLNPIALLLIPTICVPALLLYGIIVRLLP